MSELPHSGRSDLESALAAAESGEGTDKVATEKAFYRSLRAVRRRPDLAAEYGSRIGAIDRHIFESKTRLRVPVWAGSLVLGGGSLLGIAALFLAGRFAEPTRVWLFLAGFALLEVAPHSPTHWLVGRAMGIRYTHYFLGGPPPPRPGVKVDYASYLSVPPRRRAIMHASGAIVTKIVPFALMPVAGSIDLDSWVWLILWLVGIGQIGTDILFSTRSGDWRKVIRELRAARES